MVTTQRFRSALNGFNREDVVNYIEYLNNQHRIKMDQLNNQLSELQSRPVEDTIALHEQLEAALARCAQLEEQLTEAKEAPAIQPVNPVSSTEADELEAYRRAERTERLAQERAQQIYAQANAALADASLKAESAAEHIGSVADQAAEQLKECQDTILAAKSSFQDAVAALYAIRPEDEQ